MGQYWIPVNLDKKEFIDPHKLATGLKLWEQVANFPGTPCALLILTAAYYEKRGGGDLDLDENWHGRERTFPKYNISPAPMFSQADYPKVAAAVMGRWAGDRIAIVGDYAEDKDLAPEHQASKVYEKCRPQRNEKGEEIGPSEWTDVSEMVCMVIEHELKGKYEGDGWRDFIYDSDRKEWEAERERRKANAGN
jgi:hypothetical protein